MAPWADVAYVETEEECVNCKHYLDAADDGVEKWLECLKCGYWEPAKDEDDE